MLEFSNDSHLAVHFPGTSEWHCPALLHKSILNDVGDILYGKGKHVVWDSKGSCYYFIPYSNYSLDQDCINAHNLALHNACNLSISQHFLSIL